MMKLTILHPTRHNGERLVAGDTVDVPPAAGKALVAAGAAEPADLKAETKAKAAAEAEAKAAAEGEATSTKAAVAIAKKS